MLSENMPSLNGARRFVGITISTKEETWGLAHIPLYCRVGPRKRFPHAQNRPRVDFLAQERNEAMEEALVKFPDATHILNIESQYLSQTLSIVSLLDTYEQLGG